ncbi:conserved hypothetical protein [Gammaproteobacteria bacterium]
MVLRHWWPTRTPRQGIACSCVVDNHPKFYAQGALWVNCLLQYQKIPPEQVFVHLIQPADPIFTAWLIHQGIQVIPTTPFDERSPHCNKLAQLTTNFGAKARQIVLMDCDTVWLGNSSLPHIKDVAAKIVDNPNPSPEILARIFAAAGFQPPHWTDASFPKSEGSCDTDSNNCNGGLYILTQEILPALAEAWTRWARWCLEHRHLFGSSINFDQVSYALAARQLGIKTQLLGLEWNYPTHHPEWPVPNLDPQIIHYHNRVTSRMEVLPIGKQRPDAAIARFNHAMERMVEFLAC